MSVMKAFKTVIHNVKPSNDPLVVKTEGATVEDRPLTPKEYFQLMNDAELAMYRTRDRFRKALDALAKT